MHSLNGVLVMLSFLARSQVNFKLPGHCPVPTKPITLFDEIPPRPTEYYTALHYNSDSEGDHLFGATRGADNLNCLRLHFVNVSASGIILQDCEFYQGFLSPFTDNDYEIFLKNVDSTSTCQNQTIQITGLSVWADAKRDFIVFWSCSNDTQTASHKQVVVVFINSDLITSVDGRPIDKKILEKVTKYTESVMAFSGLNVTDFDVNRKLMVDHHSDCNNYNCSNHCDHVDGALGDEEGSGGPLIFFIVICFVVIIAFLVVL